MRKLNKSITKAEAYKKWQNEIIDKGEDFPKYESSKGFYYDIVAELLLIQDGLCAYTERLLYNIDEIKALDWENGKLKSPFPKVDGDLEHFDPALKEKQGWLWDNFFIADHKVNLKWKGTRPVDKILKPDEAGYDPFHLLEYDFNSHQYIPNTKTLTKNEKERVIKMLLLLGINSSPTRDLREEVIEEIKDKIKLGIVSLSSLQIKRFPTAIEMLKRNSSTNKRN